MRPTPRTAHPSRPAHPCPLLPLSGRITKDAGTIPHDGHRRTAFQGHRGTARPHFAVLAHHAVHGCLRPVKASFHTPDSGSYAVLTRHSSVSGAPATTAGTGRLPTSGRQEPARVRSIIGIRVYGLPSLHHRPHRVQADSPAQTSVAERDDPDVSCRSSFPVRFPPSSSLRILRAPAPKAARRGGAALRPRPCPSENPSNR